MEDTVEDDIEETTTTKFEQGQKNHQAVIHDLKIILGRLSDQNATRLTSALPSTTQLNPKPSGGLETDIQEQDKKKAKNKQSQARDGKDKVKVKSQPNEENTT
ncbi:hypothetical protein Tco_1526855 [Tanacetum coccineum]